MVDNELLNSLWSAQGILGRETEDRISAGLSLVSVTVVSDRLCTQLLRLTDGRDGSHGLNNAA